MLSISTEINKKLVNVPVEIHLYVKKSEEETKWSLKTKLSQEILDRIISQIPREGLGIDVDKKKNANK